MAFKGVIIEESLKETDILHKLHIISTVVEPVTKDHHTPWINQWTLHTVEVKEDIMDICRQLQDALDDKHKNWYIDIKDDIQHYFIFKQKILVVNINNKQEYEKVKEYGMSLGIPEHQLTFN